MLDLDGRGVQTNDLPAGWRIAIIPIIGSSMSYSMALVTVPLQQNTVLAPQQRHTMRGRTLMKKLPVVLGIVVALAVMAIVGMMAPAKSEPLAPPDVQVMGL